MASTNPKHRVRTNSDAMLSAGERQRRGALIDQPLERRENRIPRRKRAGGD
jgi:hypothetical protein